MIAGSGQIIILKKDYLYTLGELKVNIYLHSDVDNYVNVGDYNS